jgi:hypothetical protein
MSEASANGGTGGSLLERMRAQRERMQEQRSEKFPVPGWGTFVHVELRPLGWDAMRKIMDRHARIRDTATREVYVAADQLVAATVRFWEVDPDGDPSKETLADWTSLAKGVADNFPEDGSVRMAVLALIKPSSNVIFLWNDWVEWSGAEGEDIDLELAEDFGTTR